MKSVQPLCATIRKFQGWSLVVFGGVALAVACQSNSGGLDRDDDDDASVTNTNSSSGGSGGSQAGAAGEAGADASGGSEAGSTTSTDGGGSDATGSGGSLQNGGNGGVGGSGASGGSSNGTSATTGGTGGTGGTPIDVDDCTFHTDPAEEGAGGEGGAGAVDLQIAENNFIGSHLVDGAGRSLYVYGADYPGDCANPPVSNCADDCVLSWPVFDAGARRLGEGLPDAAFGSFMRADGLPQTTYMGWPLYYYKKDEAPGDLVGHGRGTWFAAETELPNVMVMRASEADGGIKYLCTESGRTLYMYAGDVVGTADAPPEIACVGECLNDYQPFVVNSLRPASTIDPSDITVFVRDDSGELQVAYKGAPLYITDLDSRSGALQGAATADWSIAEL